MLVCHLYQYSALKIQSFDCFFVKTDIIIAIAGERTRRGAAPHGDGAAAAPLPRVLSLVGWCGALVAEVVVKARAVVGQRLWGVEGRVFSRPAAARVDGVADAIVRGGTGGGRFEQGWAEAR